MPEKDPSNYPLLTYVWVFFLAASSGALGYMRNLKKDPEAKFKLFEFFCELGTSALAGLITFWLCEHYHIEPLMQAVLIAVSGGMGSRFFNVIEYFVLKRGGN